MITKQLLKIKNNNNINNNIKNNLFFHHIRKLSQSQSKQSFINTIQNKDRAFLDIERKPQTLRNVKDRISDYQEINIKHNFKEIKNQAARCMNCGTPFCHTHTGCPLANIIPEFNKLSYENNWKLAYQTLISTNNFPEFTGRVCPAPCEASCVASIIDMPITIKNIENSIIETAWKNKWVLPNNPLVYNDKKVAIIGSGPAGLAAADQLNSLGYNVTIFEKDYYPGGLLTYGIPNMKLDKKIVKRRINIMKKSGIKFKTNTEINETNIINIKNDFDAIILTIGSSIPNDLSIPGRQLNGIYFAMDFLTSNQNKLFKNQNKKIMAKYKKTYIDSCDKNVIIIGGGDTGTDCIATALRHNCKSLTNFEIFKKPPPTRNKIENPWPLWPRILQTNYGHEEAIYKFKSDPREFSILSTNFIGDENNNVTHIRTVNVNLDKNGCLLEIPNSEKIWPADLVILAMGFKHPNLTVLNKLNITLDKRNNCLTKNYQTSVNKIFAAGDCRKGQSLVVWAIHEGREVAKSVDNFLKTIK